MKKSFLRGWIIFLLTLPLFGLSQSRQVSGTVTDEKGSALSNVSIVQKGTTNGTVTDEKGFFSLSVSGRNPVLVFSYTGMAEHELVVGNGSTFNVSLAASGPMSEVVVTALGINRKERSLGYATQQIRGDNLTLTKEQNVIGSLAGKIAGVQVTGSSGASMGGTQKVRIRGVNSLTGTDQPLVVVDGTPLSNSNYADRNGPDYGNVTQDINPDDVESVSVLKGPAASALYGQRGQYGVIMITTKKGSKGAKKAKVEYSGALSYERAGNFMPNQNVYGGGSSQTFRTLANGQKYIDGTDESWGPKMDGTPVRMYYSFYPLDPQYGQLTPFVPQPDNIKDYYETGRTINNNISVSGGGDNATFRLSYNNANITGIEPNTWLRRNNLGVNTGLDITRKLSVTSSINYANNKGQRPSQGYYNGSTYFNQWFQRNLDLKRMENYRYPDGSILHWNLNNPTSAGVINPKPVDWNNPYFDAYENFSNDGRDRFFGNVGLSFQVLPSLKLSGFVRGDMFTQDIESRQAAGGRFVDGYAVSKYESKDMNYEFLAQYNKSWKDLSFNANLGGNILKQRYSYLTEATVGGLSSPGYYNIAASIDRPSVSSYLRRKEVRSVYGNVSFGFKNTYYVDASLRNDNSSALPADNNSYFYPGVSASMVFSELLRWKPMSYGKIRLSYAKAGADLAAMQIADVYGVGSIYTPPGSASINSLFVADQIVDKNIHPSFANSYEAGADLKFLNNRIGADFTVYKQRNVNQILSLEVSGASGYATALINAGLIESRGFEVSVNASPFAGRFFSWDASLNFARNTSTVKELYSDSASQITNYEIASNTYSNVRISVNARVGEEYGTLIGQGYKRDPKSGMIMLDANNLPIQEANHNFGGVLPDFTGGLLNNFRFGPVTLSAMIDFQKGGQFFSWSKMLSVKSGQAAETAAVNDKGHNVREPLADGGGVKVTGVSAATGQVVTAYVDARAYYRTRLGTQIYEEWLFDASYIKMRELRLGYSLGKNLVAKTPFTNINIGIIARNPFMIWQKAPKGLNPSELSAGSEPINWLETGQLITTRSFGLNLNITL